MKTGCLQAPACSLPVYFQRLSIFISSRENTDQVAVSRRRERIEFQYLPQIFFGIAGVAGIKIGESEFVLSIRIVRIEIHQRDQTFHSFFILSLDGEVASFNQALLAVGHSVAQAISARQVFEFLLTVSHG